MESFYLLDYLKENSNLDPTYLDILKFDLDKRLYYYGGHFKFPFERKKTNFSKGLYNNLKTGYTIVKILQNNFKYNNKDVIFSNAYFTVNKELSDLGYEVFCPNWHLTKGGNVFPDIELYIASQKIVSQLKKANFRDLVTDSFIAKIKEFEEKLISAFQKRKIKAVILSNDMTFFEKILIIVCKKIRIPTFIFLHGLPGRYNNIDENRTDYLIVWGDKIKENYIKHGFNRNKIFVSGHPYYKKPQHALLKYTLDRTLVLTKSMHGGQHSDKVRLADRGNSILYLLSIEKVLRKFGVKSVMLRSHPSENINWYYQFIDREFFISDNRSLEKSITESSFVIGPTSTVFLESIYYGRNYLVFEPSVEGIDLCKFDLIPPFDKSDNRIPVAINEDELHHIIKERITVDNNIFSEYIKTPFDLSWIKKLI